MQEQAPETFLAALRERGIRRIRQVRFKNNRERLLSLSRDGDLLNVHVCFATAPAEILDSLADFLRARDGSAESRNAIAVLRDWPGTRDGLDRAREDAAARNGGDERVPKAGHCCGTAAQRRYLRRLYVQLNRERFRGGLPRDLPIRLSNRMETRYGHVRYHVRRSGKREVVELALNVDLMLDGNEQDLLDTMLHEMAHIEAWLSLGHRGHGRPWKRVARRVGCEARACAQGSLRRRRRRGLTVTRVPTRELVPAKIETSQFDLFTGMINSGLSWLAALTRSETS
jgi:hypothetical protein